MRNLKLTINISLTCHFNHFLLVKDIILRFNCIIGTNIMFYVIFVINLINVIIIYLGYLIIIIFIFNIFFVLCSTPNLVHHKGGRG